ncbi:hypothetical protein TrRE_jg2325 [Triparma retinervis]|uniref:Methyltransferase domain-containing protein n=1 Tax=Triparma retinervis TaxID=2557542 RepID=A0A9W7L6E1_9STRA|nr:hypothetical protein TrRE_jg2325 [Triparma retinervis]
MYGYNDIKSRVGEDSPVESDDEMDPLRAGMYLDIEGEASLAPCCGCELSTVKDIMDLCWLHVEWEFVLRESGVSGGEGCGDGEIVKVERWRKGKGDDDEFEIDDDSVNLSSGGAVSGASVDDEIMLDLGCGDGRLCFGSITRGFSKSVGVELEADVCARFRELIDEAVEENRLSFDSVRCIEGDLRDVNVGISVPDWGETTCVTAYLLPEGLAIIEEPLREWLMADGTGGGGTGGGGQKRLRRRVVCNTWGFKGWVPVRKVVLEEMNGTPLWLYDKSSVLGVVNSLIDK